MKTKEELDALKQEVEALNAKLTALSEDELAQVAGGAGYDTRTPPPCIPGPAGEYREPCELRWGTPGGSQSSAVGDSIIVPSP